MSDLLERLKALRGETVASSEPAAEPVADRDRAGPDRASGSSQLPGPSSPPGTSHLPEPQRMPHLPGQPASAQLPGIHGIPYQHAGGRVDELGFDEPAAQLGARPVRCEDGVHLARETRLLAGATHGNESLGRDDLHPLLLRQAGAGSGRRGQGPVLYIDTETTGLAGGTGTFAFLIGVGLHGEDGFEVRQLFMPGPEHERSQLKAFAALAADAAAVVTYNGASFDIPLLRNRFAMNGMADPLAGVPHLDLLTLARRLWKEILPDCTLSTVERRILGARRSLNDVPGFEVPARYFAFLRSRDASGLRGVLEHNETDIVALTALRFRVERLLDEPQTARAAEAHALGQWLERLGEQERALTRYLEAARSRREAAWHASLLLKRLGRVEEAAELWISLGRQGSAAAWVELAKLQEHQWHDFEAALESVEAATQCRDCGVFELEKRRERLLRRAARMR